MQSKIQHPGINFCSVKNLFTYLPFNAETLSSESELSELIQAAMETNQEEISIQEHRLYHPDFVLKHHYLGENWILITSFCSKNSVGGVGILLSPRAQRASSNIESKASKILVVSFHGNPKTTIAACYSPTNCSDETDVIDFYYKLSGLTRQFSKHNTVILAGDFNAKLGRENGFIHSYNQSSNRNDFFLTEIIKENKLVCLNTMVQKEEGKKLTFSYPNNTKTQLDYILVNRKWSVGRCIKLQRVQIF